MPDQFRCGGVLVPTADGSTRRTCFVQERGQHPKRKDAFNAEELAVQ